MREHPEIAKLLERRSFIQLASAGSFVSAFGGLGLISDELTRLAHAGRPKKPNAVSRRSWKPASTPSST
jgi:hypothetical protein